MKFFKKFVQMIRRKVFGQVLEECSSEQKERVGSFPSETTLVCLDESPCSYDGQRATGAEGLLKSILLQVSRQERLKHLPPAPIPTPAPTPTKPVYKEGPILYGTTMVYPLNGSRPYEVDWHGDPIRRVEPADGSKPYFVNFNGIRFVNQ